MAPVGLPVLMRSKMVESMGGNAAKEAEFPLAIGALREMDPKRIVQLTQGLLAIEGPQFLVVMVAGRSRRPDGEDCGNVGIDVVPTNGDNRQDGQKCTPPQPGCPAAPRSWWTRRPTSPSQFCHSLLLASA